MIHLVIQMGVTNAMHLVLVILVIVIPPVIQIVQIAHHVIAVVIQIAEQKILVRDAMEHAILIHAILVMEPVIVKEHVPVIHR